MITVTYSCNQEQHKEWFLMSTAFSSASQRFSLFFSVVHELVPPTQNPESYLLGKNSAVFLKRVVKIH